MQVYLKFLPTVYSYIEGKDSFCLERLYILVTCPGSYYMYKEAMGVLVFILDIHGSISIPDVIMNV